MDFSSQKRPKTLNFDLCTLKNGHQMKLVWLGNLWAYSWEYKANYWLLYIFYWLQFGFSNDKILIFYLKIKKIKKNQKKVFLELQSRSYNPSVVQRSKEFKQKKFGLNRTQVNGSRFLCGSTQFQRSGSFGSPLMYTVRMGVLTLIKTNGKVNQARYKSSPRAREPIHSD